MRRPPLTLQTVYFHDSDREDARRLGADLYERLTRPTSDPLAPGPGIPVRVGVQAGHVKTDAADTMVLIPVLGKQTYVFMADQALAQIEAWHVELGAGHVLVVPTSENWRNREDELRGKQMLTMLYAKDDPRRRTMDEIVLACTRIWEPNAARVRLFISHAKADLSDTQEAAKIIHDFVATDTTGGAFFDATDLRPGESLGEQVEDALTHGVLIAVRGDTYSSRVWCQRELLHAKLNGLPTLSVEMLRRGEMRSSPYGGNTPSLVWEDKNPPEKNASRVVSAAMVQWLRAKYFERDAERIKEAADLPADVKVVARPPELLDLAQGPLHGDQAVLVLHPDPELSVVERRVLKGARPRLHFATPTTVFRRLLGRQDEAPGVSSPLEGMQIAMSLSSTPDAEGPEGFTEHHVRDATIQIARTLISSGAAIAYGGDFRAGGYTHLLGQLVQTYNQTAARRGKDLQIYLAALGSPENAPDDIPMQIKWLKQNPWKVEAGLPDPDGSNKAPDSLYFSDMRRVMEKQVQARVILGGNSRPRTEAGGQGYGGRYPGLVEEAWRSLQAANPLYVAGGFGGAAAIVADLLQGKGAPGSLQDSTWMVYPYYKENAAVLDSHPSRSALGLPATMEDISEEVVKLGKARLATDDSARAWNGLSIAENNLLFRSRDPIILAALVSKGLLTVVRQQNQGKLQIELVNDSLAVADNLDAIAIATLDNVPLGGAGAAIDRVTGGSVSDARALGRKLISLKDTLIDADWLFMASLGALGSPATIPDRVKEAALATAEQIKRHGFQRVGVVSFGGSILSETQTIANAMLQGFSNIPEGTVLVWYETDKNRFETLCALLQDKKDSIKLTTRRALAKMPQSAGVAEMLHLEVSLESGQLETSCLPPSSSATARKWKAALSDADLAALTVGQGPSQRATPKQEALDQRGVKLAGYLFGPNATEMLSKCKDSKMVVVHDTAASKIPFEMLFASPDLRPASGAGMSRRLLVQDLAFERQFAKPPRKGKLRVLLIANPTKDLDGAQDEAEAVESVLATQKQNLELQVLRGDEATVQRVKEELVRSDILHYCGHAFFDGPELGESGLVLAGKTEFTGKDLAGIEPLPRMAFVNACEAGRVRGAEGVEATAFAELFLRSGIDAYLGTYWEVSDAAASAFAGKVYMELALGKPLDQAVVAGRKELFSMPSPDWANYILFGGASFRLIADT